MTIFRFSNFIVQIQYTAMSWHSYKIKVYFWKGAWTRSHDPRIFGIPLTISQ